MSVLYMLRHGQASFGQGDYDRLSDLGRQQASLAGRHLALAGVRFDAVYYGEMRRQHDSAAALLAGLEGPPPLIVMPGWEEYDSGAIMQALLPALLAADPGLAQWLPALYQDRKAFQRVYEAAMRLWVAGECPDGVECWATFRERARQALGRVLAAHQGGQTVLVVSSGGPIAACAQAALGLADAMALPLTWVLRNASLTSFLYRGQELTLSTFNSVAHLEQTGQPGLLTYR